MDGAHPVFYPAVTGKTLVRSGPIQLCSFNIDNETGGNAYLQMFDAASITDVTLGTTLPDRSFIIRGNGTAQNAYSVNPLNFLKGLVIAATTTATGSTLVNTGIVANLGIR